MSYTFEEIMEFHPGNKGVYDEIKDLLPRLVPFVGAGLTQFAYYSWSGALKDLSKKLTNRTNRATVNALIKAGKCLEAADMLADLRGELNLAHDLAGLFSPNRLEQKQEQLCKEPISLLPYLFNELVITTNFDETLETVYENAGARFDRVFLPKHPELLRQIRREGGVRGLYKLHGTLTVDKIEYENILFTKKQYDEHYGENSPLTVELKDCFKEKVMLFLGCSLNNDRTMELLQEVIQPGCDHYTIINCKRSERDAKIRQLADKHIRAIVYEGNRHEAVRVILEHLLEETNPTAYKGLPFHVGALKQANLLDRFSYESDFIPFTGRTSELQKLKDFLGDPNVPFRWWAVTGPGGSGKSRLVHEFQKNNLPQGWNAHYLERSDYENLASLTKQITQKKLLIADYVQEHAKEIGAWMEQLNETPHSLPIRVLLVEREADDNQDTTAWTRQLYEETRHTTQVKGACYQEKFLKLQPLCDADLLEIIKNYAEELNKKALTDAEKQMLLDTLKLVDSDLCRPLYAMFLTDAYVEGKNPERWNKKEILDYVIEREQKRMEFNIEQTLGLSDDKLYDACLHLLSMATVLQDASLEELQKLCPNLWKTIEKKADDYDDVFDSPDDMLEQVGLAVNGQVSALRPDLIGEYYVYTWLLDNREKAKEFLSAAWQKPYSTAVFFYRLLKDYAYLLNESTNSWELILPEVISLSERTALLYATLLANATIYCKIVKECERHAKMQEVITKKYPKNSEIAISFARSLANLSLKQDEQEAQRTLVRLELLTEENPYVPEIAIVFAKGLFNMSNKQDEQGRQEYVARLERLEEEQIDVPEIAIVFAMGLVNLSYQQDEKVAEKSVAHLESLMKKYKAIPDFAIEFAKGLFNLTIKQDGQGRKETVARLESLAEEYKEVPEIAIWFAKGLFNMSNKQDEQGRQEYVARLERLEEEQKEVPEIAIVFAKGLVNLSYHQDEQEAKRTVARLESLAKEHKEVPEIVSEFAKGLVNLSLKQDEQEAKRTVARLESLAKKHKEVPEIAIEFAKGLFNLTIKQDEQGRKETVARLESLVEEYKEVPEIAIWFSNGLFNLSCEQDELGMKKTVARLESLANKHNDVPEIAIEFAKGLFNLSCKQDEQGMKETVARLESLAEEYKDVPEIAVNFADGLVNLSTRQEEQRSKETVDRLEGLAKEHPNVPEIAINFAMGLFNLSKKQGEQGAKDTVARLESLTQEHKDVPEIAINFATGLFDLCYKQDAQGAEKIVARLEKLMKEHKDVPEIELYFATGLFNLSTKQDEQGRKKTLDHLDRFISEHPEVIQMLDL